MGKRRTFIVEMTGVFGAGYVPRLLDFVMRLLREDFIVPGDDSRSVATRYHVDDTGARGANSSVEARTTELILKAEKPDAVTESEWPELVSLLALTEQHFIERLESWPNQVDVAFRRGGRLHDYVLLHAAPHMVAHVPRDPRTAPKLQVLLRAEMNTIRESFEEPYIQKLIRDRPGVYNSSPERAYEQQERWIERVRDSPGLYVLTRHSVPSTDYARQIVDELAPLLTAFSVLRSRPPGLDAFVSYAWDDRDYVQALAVALSALGVRLWFDQVSLEKGESIPDALARAISAARHGIVILSPAYLKRTSGSWAGQELAAMMAKRALDKRFLIPVWLDISASDLLTRQPLLAAIAAIVATGRSTTDVAAEITNAIVGT